ncbi:MAG: DUF1501 domain-containing protein [Pseudomonadota bacterium]
MTDLSLSRRRLLSALGTGAAALPLLSLPGFVKAAGQSVPAGNILVLVELAGGNDGLNTVVPVTDPRYRHLRPEIGLSAADMISLDAETGLHAAMRSMAAFWDQGEMQIVEGVGYPNPNRSHFRSIEIWNAGQGADSTEQRGWVSSVFAGTTGEADVNDAAGLVLGGDMGPLDGAGRFSAMRDTDTFFETLDHLPGMQHAVRPAPARSPLEHVLATYDSAQVTGEAIRRKLEASKERRWRFPESALGEQLRTAARLLDAGVQVPVLKVVQDGYDTHDAQPDTHAYLLTDLSEAIDAFAKAMRDIGLWNHVTIVTYSEFGRTARENASGGTDHGTAAPVFVVGGQVAGGLGGQRPSLEQLEDGEMIFTTDYRSLYGAILQDLWGIAHDDFGKIGQSPQLLRV